MRVKGTALLVLLLFCQASWVHATVMENFPVPPQMNVWWIANGNVHNGQVLFIKRFKSRLTIEKVAEFYRSEWQSNNDNPGYMQDEASDWLIISHLTAEYQWVVQIRSDSSGSGSEGILSVMTINTGSNTTMAGVRSHKKFTESLSGGNLLSSTYSTKPQPARTQLYVYTESPARLANRFKSHLALKGWALQDEFTHNDTITQRFNDTRRQLDIAFVEQSRNKTLVLVNEVTTSER